MKIDEKMSPRERLLLFDTLELLRKEIQPKFSDWKDADDWLFSQLDFTKDELRQVYEGRNVMYYDGSAVDFDEAKKKRFDAMFVFDDELQVNEEFTGVNGYLWATDGLMEKLADEVGSWDVNHGENFNFYANYDVVTKEATVDGSYFVLDGSDVEKNLLFTLELSNDEKEALIERFEAYSKSHGRELSLFDFVNEARGDYDMPLLSDFAPNKIIGDSLDDKIKQAKRIEQSEGKRETVNKDEIDRE